MHAGGMCRLCILVYQPWFACLDATVRKSCDASKDYVQTPRLLPSQPRTCTSGTCNIAALERRLKDVSGADVTESCRPGSIFTCKMQGGLWCFNRDVRCRQNTCQLRLYARICVGCSASCNASSCQPLRSAELAEWKRERI